MRRTAWYGAADGKRAWPISGRKVRSALWPKGGSWYSAPGFMRLGRPAGLRAGRGGARKTPTVAPPSVRRATADTEAGDQLNAPVDELAEEKIEEKLLSCPP